MVVDASLFRDICSVLCMPSTYLDTRLRLTDRTGSLFEECIYAGIRIGQNRILLT